MKLFIIDILQCLHFDSFRIRQIVDVSAALLQTFQTTPIINIIMIMQRTRNAITQNALQHKQRNTAPDKHNMHARRAQLELIGRFAVAAVDRDGRRRRTAFLV